VVVTQTVDARKLRAEFPIFEQRMHGKALAHVDSATSAQKPKVRAFVNATSTQGSLHAIGDRGTSAATTAPSLRRDRAGPGRPHRQGPRSALLDSPQTA
jgi:hypothetical protein